MFYAAQEGHVHCVQMMVNVSKADSYLCTDDDLSPLMAAAQVNK